VSVVSNRVVSLWLCWTGASTAWQVVLSAVSCCHETTRTQVTLSAVISVTADEDRRAAFIALCGMVVLPCPQGLTMLAATLIMGGLMLHGLPYDLWIEWLESNQESSMNDCCQQWGCSIACSWRIFSTYTVKSGTDCPSPVMDRTEQTSQKSGYAMSVNCRWLQKCWVCCCISFLIYILLKAVFENAFSIFLPFLNRHHQKDSQKFNPLITHTHTQPFYGPLGFCSGLPGWAGTRKVKPISIYWSKR